MSDYEKEINKRADYLKESPEELKTILRNYDELLKEKYGQTDLPLPYWCYGFCGSESLEEIVKSGGVADE